VLRSLTLVAGKDLRIELRSKVAFNQILPFALVVLFLFAFALDPDRGALKAATPGLFWVAVLLTLLLGVGRSSGLEAADGTRDAIRLSGLDPAGVFLGKALALAVQLLVLEAALLVGVVVLYEPDLRAGGAVLLVTSALVTTAGLAATGTLYGSLAAGVKTRETLLPLLLLPVVAPVLIGATRSFEAALGTGGAATSEGWPWVGLLGVFALLYTGLGVVVSGPLLEEA
jgi:heme exporter protein B